MNCPNCDREMENTYNEWWAHDMYICKKCKITYTISPTSRKWDIPNKFLPTEKQKKTILFINNHLNMDLESLTKHQCWIDIGKYFEEAKNTQLHTDEWYEDLQECFSMCEGDFC